MKVLILTFYFRPDLSAGSFRTTALVEALKKFNDQEISIDVVTTMPNRYHSFTSEASEKEVSDNVTIYRIALPEHKSGFLDQSRAFIVFLRKALKIVANKNYNIVFATSSRLMTAVLGAYIAKQKKTKLYLDIRDIFVDTIKDVLPKKISYLLYPIFSIIESWAIRSANHINLVSKGFSGYFQKRYPDKNFSYFTNGIDPEFLSVPETNQSIANHRPPIKVLYAGNIGEGQGLHNIIPQLAKVLGESIHFIIIGDGGYKELLKNIIINEKIMNVEILPPIKRDELIQKYLKADILFLHLNNYEAFKKVLPSKIFEYAALGKPIWAGVAGYAAQFIKSEVSNASTFNPGDVKAAIEELKQLKITCIPRHDFISKYSRARISQELSKSIINTITL